MSSKTTRPSNEQAVARWVPANSEVEPYQAAKRAAKEATEGGREVTTRSPHAKSTMISTIRKSIRRPRSPAQ